jgi:hypothetical protein
VATHDDDGEQETDEMPAPPAVTGVGEDHVVPFQLTWLPALSAATHEVADEQEIEVSALPGSMDVGAVHFPAAKPTALPWLSTASQTYGVGQDSADSPPPLSTAWAGSHEIPWPQTNPKSLPLPMMALPCASTATQEGSNVHETATSGV